MLLNKKKRIALIGFDDFWFMIIGIIILSLIVDYLFNNSFANYNFREATVNWSISLFFSTIDWFIIRGVMIHLRKRYPSFDDNVKRIVIFFLLLVSTIILVDAIGNILLENYFGDTYNRITRSRIIVPVVIISVMTMAIYEAIYYYVRLRKSIREEEQSKRIIVQAQLDALTNQAQPHFLFNSLNTLRDIIEQNSKEDAKKFVDKLSNVYRFILETDNAHLITLADELKFAHSYIHIQSERFGDNLKMIWDIDEASLEKFIVPMSLQLLLENAIKHNIISKSKPLIINVSIKNNQLIVENKLQLKSTQLPSTKVGLKNIENRYRLITDKIPEVIDNGSTFKVTLNLLNTTDQIN